ncbi:MAG TPA: 8-oxoguanine deaminase [Jatrophihabitans sp.]|nr:8-oxoguanine deaminase [Jatrophihabitans sp.]
MSGPSRRLTPPTVVEGCAVATVDRARTEHAEGHLVLRDGVIEAVGPGRWPGDRAGAEVVDGRGLLATPGLVNSHDHLYQWITRGRASDHTLFAWLTELYPVWARLTPELLAAAAAAKLGWLALTGCTTSADHHYLFPPRPGGGDRLAQAAELVEAEIAAAAGLGLRLELARGSMNLGRSAGGLPPDEVVERHDDVLAATDAAIARWHDPGPAATVRIAVAPCSPFSVTPELMRDSAALARERGVRLHTHLAETTDEHEFCQQRFGRSPVEYAADLGWLGEDVWLAHGVHLDDQGIKQLAATGTGVAHCPTSNGRLGAGIAPVSQLLAAGSPVGLGVDGAASNEAGRMVDELRQAVLAARYRGGPRALTVRQALELATLGGARCLGRDAELGSLEVGKQADVALWRIDDLAGAGIADPVAALVLGAATVEHLFVGGRPVVQGRTLVTADAGRLAAAAAVAARRIGQE